MIQSPCRLRWTRPTWCLRPCRIWATTTQQRRTRGPMRPRSARPATLRVKPLPRETVTCESCGEPIVVLSGEDGQWHLLREAEVKAFFDEQEQIRADSYEQDEAALLEAGFLIGDQQVDVVEEADYQQVLERLAGGRSRTGAMKPVVALLTREPDHPHDKNAVRVDVDGETVGYIEKWNAKSIQPLLLKLQKAGRPAWVRGTIVGGWEDDSGDDAFRIRLDGLPKV